MRRLRNISRIDSGHTHCWFYRRTILGARRVATFSDGLCGGKTQALKAAIAYRDLMEEIYPPEDPAIQHRPRRYATARNASGATLAGVNYTEWRRRRGGKIHSGAYWQAHFTAADGERLTRRWSVEAHGFEAAQRQAERWRLERLREYQRATGIRITQ